MQPIRWRARTRAELEMVANPQSANQPECFPYVLYDTQTYVDNTTTSLTFFTSTNSDKTLSNMEGSGQLPDPQWFEIHYMTCDLLATPVVNAGHTAAALGNLQDVQLLMDVGRPTFTLTISNKNYGPLPLNTCAALGGATGFGWGTFTAEASVAYANNGIPGSGGFPWGGALVIPPKMGFNVVLNWAAAQDISGNVPIRMGLCGVLYRRVL